MIIDISKIEMGSTRIDRTYAGEDLAFEYRDCRLVGEWKLTAELSKNSREEVMVKARMVGTVEAPCDRCLEDFRIEMDHRFDAYLIPAHRAATHGKETEVTQDNVDEVFYTDARISLVDMLTEQIMLNLPAKILCRENCAGLCPGCGENLNDGKCSCRSAGDDPRLNLLQEMRKRIK